MNCNYIKEAKVRMPISKINKDELKNVMKYLDNMTVMPGLDKETLQILAKNGLTLKSLKILDKTKKDEDLTI